MEVKKFELTREDYIFVVATLLSWGFKRITRKDSQRTFKRLDLSPPREITGAEAGFIYTANGYSVVVWITYLEAEGKWRDTGTDACWVLIREGDREKYFAKPMPRIPGVIVKMLSYAWIAKWKIDNRPLCDHCKAYMHIKRKKGGRQYYWICENNHSHVGGKPKFKSWDCNLPPKAQLFLNKRRELTKKYKDRLKKENKVVVPAAVKRKRWRIGNPENKI